MTKNLLPNQYRKFATATAVLAVITLFFTFPLAEALQFQEAWLDRIVKDVFLISLLAVVFSKEKNETEEIELLRLKELKGAVGFGGFVLLLDSVQEIIFWNGEYEIKTGYEIMVGMLLFYLVVFNLKKSQLRKKQPAKN